MEVINQRDAENCKEGDDMGGRRNLEGRGCKYWRWQIVLFSSEISLEESLHDHRDHNEVLYKKNSANPTLQQIPFLIM